MTKLLLKKSGNSSTTTIDTSTKEPSVKVEPIDATPVPEPNIAAKEVSNEVKDNPSKEKMEVSIPRNLFTGFSEVLFEQQLILAKAIADQFGLDESEVIEACLPDAPKVKPVDNPVKEKKAKKAKKEKITDYKEAKEVDDLKAFNMSELKDILSGHDLPVGGSKPKLMARVWGILHPDQAPKEEPKKRGRKPKSKNSKGAAPTTVEVDSISAPSEADSEECEMDPSNMPDIFLTDDGKVVESAEDGAKKYKKMKKYVFYEGDEEMEYKGQLNSDTNSVTWEEDLPAELLKLLGMDED